MSDVLSTGEREFVRVLRWTVEHRCPCCDMGHEATCTCFDEALPDGHLAESLSIIDKLTRELEVANKICASHVLERDRMRQDIGELQEDLDVARADSTVCRDFERIARDGGVSNVDFGNGRVSLWMPGRDVNGMRLEEARKACSEHGATLAEAVAKLKAE